MKEIQAYRKDRFEWQTTQICSLSSNYVPTGANSSRKSFLGRRRPQAISLGDGIMSLRRKPWDAVEARCTGLGTEMTNAFTHMIQAMHCNLLFPAVFAKPATLPSSTSYWAVGVILGSMALFWDCSMQLSGEGSRQNLSLFSSSFPFSRVIHLALCYDPLANGS